MIFLAISHVFDRNSSPATDERVDKLALDMESPVRRELNNIDSNSATGRRHIVPEPTVTAHYAKEK